MAHRRKLFSYFNSKYFRRHKKSIVIVLTILVFLIVGMLFLFAGKKLLVSSFNNFSSATSSPQLVLYKKNVPHLFFHSLIIYPSRAKTDPIRWPLLKNNMITVSEFKFILQKLYENNFVLIDSRLLYTTNAGGYMSRPPLYIPKGKKPFVLSLDDVNYYETMQKDGLANKLVFESGKISTQVTLPDGSVKNTDDGDVIPLVDRFIETHPDFSFNGARGIIGVTGYDGILGYRTQLFGHASTTERETALSVVAALKREGWIFASHSYTHSQGFLRGDISADFLADDLNKWKEFVEPLVGPTNIFIGPYGQIFSPEDSRRKQILEAGFNVLYGVGLDQYLKYFPTYMVQDRVDVDGYRLTHDQKYLHHLLDI